jgi:hypothetical protein
LCIRTDQHLPLSQIPFALLLLDAFCCMHSTLVCSVNSSMPRSTSDHSPLHFLFVTVRIFDYRIADYWEGYKLFCYAFYSHSLQYEIEFEHSKLGSCFSIAICLVSGNLCVTFHFQGRWASTGSGISHSVHVLSRYYKAACMEAPHTHPSSLPPCVPHYMHAQSPSCGDVLQVGVAGGLQRSRSPYATFRLGIRVGVKCPGAVSSAHDPG